jgi:hypothetical protein
MLGLMLGSGSELGAEQVGSAVRCKPLAPADVSLVSEIMMRSVCAEVPLLP